MLINILAVGDICGVPGLQFLENHLKDFKKAHDIAFAVVNGENANVVGITPKQAEQIFRAGADAITLGNHTWIRTELQPYLETEQRILRPINYAPQCPGRGIAVFPTEHGDICVLNLLGRFTLDNNTDNPRIYYVRGDQTIRAIFAEGEVGIDNALPDDMITYVEGRSLFVRGADGLVLSVYDALGRRVYHSDSYHAMSIALPGAGVYVVRLGNGAMRKVVAAN